jgi:hypothetical protein
MTIARPQTVGQYRTRTTAEGTARRKPALKFEFHENNIYRLSSYLSENIMHLYYQDQDVKRDINPWRIQEAHGTAICPNPPINNFTEKGTKT